jgi:hypothetical protein
MKLKVGSRVRIAPNLYLYPGDDQLKGTIVSIQNETICRVKWDGYDEEPGTWSIWEIVYDEPQCG